MVKAWFYHPISQPYGAVECHVMWGALHPLKTHLKTRLKTHLKTHLIILCSTLQLPLPAPLPTTSSLITVRQSRISLDKLYTSAR